MTNKRPGPDLDLGDITITWLNGGEFKLDGGTMYGAVPKLLWQKKYPADAENYIRLRNSPLLLQTPKLNILVDTGLGNKFSRRQEAVYQIDRPWTLPEELLQTGLNRTDIDIVILTHCDFDHAGGIIMRKDNGETELTFPRARHIIQKAEWFDVTHPDSRSIHTYFPENFSGLEESGQLERVSGNLEIAPGIVLQFTGGHTRGFQLVEINGAKGSAVHFGDLFPTHTHANPLWIMAYDNFPLEVIRIKEKLIPKYQKQGCWFSFYHDIYLHACRLDHNGRIAERLPV